MRIREAASLTAATVLIGGGLALLAAPAAQAAGTTRYVDAANPNATDSDNDCTDPSRPCKTIQYAVGLAADGETGRRA